MLYSTDWLLDQLAQDARVKYLFFWGSQPSRDGIITKSCLSQWWLADFVVADVTYRTAEHRMMAEKARLFADEAALAQILAAPSPVDTIWGIGLGADSPDVQNPALWQGPNLLGFALMEVRDQLRKS